MTHQTAFKGSPLALEGSVIEIGATLPEFVLTGNEMQDIRSQDFKNKRLAIVTVPSLDTPVCSVEAKRFNEEATKLGEDVVVLVVSMDLPFAQKRWCAAEGVERIITASDFKHRQFANKFGVFIPSWGLLSRAVFVVNSESQVVHVEYVKEISSEPDYQAALQALK